MKHFKNSKSNIYFQIRFSPYEFKIKHLENTKLKRNIDFNNNSNFKTISKI